MDLSGAGAPPGDALARLTLLALRAAAPATATVRPDRVITRPPRVGRSVEEAVRALAALPKPMDCWAELEGDTLVVTAVPITYADDDPEWPASAIAGTPSEPAPTLADLYMRDLRRAHGDAYAGVPILCVGRGEAVVVRAAAVEAWVSEYQVWHQVDASFPRPISLVRLDDASARLARDAGANWLMTFGPVGDDGVAGRLVIWRLADGGSVSCVRCHDRPAQFEVTWYDGRAEARRLCQRCVDEELEAHHFNAGRDVARKVAALAEAELVANATRLAELAEGEAREWALRVTPPPIRAFITRHRRP